jgi:hypothetical protein
MSSEEPRSSQTRRASSTHAEVEAGAARHGFDARRRTDGQLSSFLQARAYARQLTTRMQAGGRWSGSGAEAAHRRCDQARRSCRRLRGCADCVSAAHAREQWRLSREQENPEVRGGDGIANQSGSNVSSQRSTTSSSFYSSSIARMRPQHLEETPEPPSSFFDPCVPEHHRRGKADCCRHGPP